MATENPKPPHGDPLHRLVELVETLVGLAQGQFEQRTPRPAQHGYLTKKEIAQRLGVSTRWVERHVVPTAQPHSRGRAFYAIEDVERQLASMRTTAPTRGRREAAAPRAPETRRIEEQLERAVGRATRR